MAELGPFKVNGVLNEGAYGKIFTIKIDSKVKIFKAFVGRTNFTEFFQILLREIFYGKILLREHYIASAINIFSDNTVVGGYIQDVAKASIKSLFPLGSIPLIAEKFWPIVQQLHRLHEQEIMHRDIKPHNILQAEDSSFYLIDTSLSIRTAEAYSENVITLWYRPLEILEKKSYDYKCDIWSLGITLLEAYEGLSLLCKIDKESDAIQFIKQHFQPNIVLVPGASQNEKLFNSLLTQMLAVNPVHRISIYEVMQHEFWTIYKSTATTTSHSSASNTTISSSTFGTSVVTRALKADDYAAYADQVVFRTRIMDIPQESMPIDERIHCFGLLIKFGIKYRLPFNIPLLALYFIDMLYPIINHDQKAEMLGITSLFAATSLESDVFPTMKVIAHFFGMSSQEMDNLFPHIVHTFELITRCPLPNTLRKARYIQDIRMIPLHMCSQFCWKLSIQDIQRIFTIPGTHDKLWLSKIEEVEKHEVYQKQWIHEHENGRPHISYYF